MKNIAYLLILLSAILFPQDLFAQCYQNGVPCGTTTGGTGGSSGTGGTGPIYGTDGSQNQPVLTDSNGRIITNINSLPPLPTGSNSIGNIGSVGSLSSITNPVATTQSGTWTVGLNGSLPGFSTTPTFNIGTLGGAASDSSLQAIKTALGTPLQAGGSVILGTGSNTIGSVNVNGPVPVTQSGTWNLGTLSSITNPVTVTGTIAANMTNPLPAGTAIIGNLLRAIPYNETTTSLAASATFAGAARDSGVVGSATPWNTFSCFTRADQAGTISMQASNDNSVWYTEQSQAMSANVTVVLTGRVYTRYHRCQVVNGTSAQTSFVVNSQLGQ